MPYLLPGFPFSNKLNFCVPASRFCLLVRRCLVYGAQVPYLIKVGTQYVGEINLPTYLIVDC